MSLDRIVVLGTATALMTKYYNTCFAYCRGDDIFLVDGGGGEGILRQFENTGLQWPNVHDFFITHEHTDHLLGSIAALRYISYLMIKGRYEGHLRVYCHRELAEKTIAICKMVLRPAEREQVLNNMKFVNVHDGETLRIAGRAVTFFDIHSTKAPQFGFQMHLDEKVLTFLGDEPCHESSVRYVKNADWLLSEAYCLYGDREIHTPYAYHHSTVREASELAQKYGVKNLILWHTEDTTWPHRQELYTAESRQYYTGNVLVPEDLDVIILND